MNRSSRLRPIADLAAHRENDASRQLVAAQKKLEEQKRLLGELEAYHADYTNSNRISHVASADPVRLQDYRLFLDRLEQAMASQQQLIARLLDEHAAIQTDWKDRRSHRKALDNAAERYAHSEARDVEQREQAQMEEVSALLRGRTFLD